MKLKVRLLLALSVLLLIHETLSQTTTTTKPTNTTKSTTTTTATRSTTTKPTTTTRTTTTTYNDPLVACELCKNGKIFLILQPNDIPNGFADLYQAIDKTVFTQLSIDTKATTSSFYLTQQTFTDNGLESSFQIRLQPILERQNANEPLRISVSQKSVCLLFEKCGLLRDP